MSAPTANMPKESTIEPTVSGRALKVSFVMIAVGLILTLCALFGDGALRRLGFAWLWAAGFVWAIALGSLFFVGLQHVTRAVWSVVVRRVAEMFAASMWAVGILFIPVMLFVVIYEPFGIFPWADPEVVTGDHVLEGKRPYLNQVFFIARGVVYFLLWIGFTSYFVRRSLAQDGGGDAAITVGMRKVSAPFLLVFALTATFASFDWFMSLDPHWFSTILGVYVFAGMTVAALSAIVIAVIWLRASGRLGGGIVRNDHLYSLGALLFAFTCFWGYIAFSQFMLIWYGNIPEETVYFIHRTEHGWLGVTLALVALRFVLPFFLLLSRDSKMNPRRLIVVSALCLVGQLVDLYWLIMPQASAAGPRIGWQEFGPLLLMTGILVWCAARFLSRHKPLPVGDPFFQKSCDFHL